MPRGVVGAKLNKAVIVPFLKSTPIYPAGARVITRGGDLDEFRGRVSLVNPTRLDRPVVTLERDPKNEEIHPTQVDLTHELGSRIEARSC